MKKVLVAFSLICFVAVNSVIAQTPTATATSQKESTSTAAPAATAKETPAMNCHGSTKKSCCKNGEAKNCTPAQRAACGDHAKAEAPATKEDPGTK